MYEWHDVGMDLFELARTFQADREREIEATMRRRRLLARSIAPSPDRGTTDPAAARLGSLGQAVSSPRTTR